MADVSTLDLYSLLEIDPDASEKEIKKGYRKKALTCHPDKNPDNPKAAELFHQLSKALEILTDKAARAAYDRVLKAKKAAEKRNKELDSKRKKLKEDLESRERISQNDRSTENAAEKLQAEVERLRKEGSKHLAEEQEILRQQILKEHYESGKTMKIETKVLPRLKVKWRVVRNDDSNGGYTEEILHSIFRKYGEIACLIVSNSKKGSAMVEFITPNAAAAAVQCETGLRTNPLKISWVQGKPVETEVRNLKFDGPQPSAQPVSTNTSVTERDYESLVLMKLRQAEERRKLIEDMMKDDEGGS